MASIRPMNSVDSVMGFSSAFMTPTEGGPPVLPWAWADGPLAVEPKTTSNAKAARSGRGVGDPA